MRARTGPGGAPSLGTWHTFRQYFSGVTDRRLWVVFDADLLPGYAWVFPVAGGGANVGFGLLRGGPAATDGKSLARVWEGLADRPAVRRALGPDAQPEGRRQAWPIPADYSRAALTHGRFLFAGDSANVVDPMTGEGIAQALETGVLAAPRRRRARTGGRRRSLPRRGRLLPDGLILTPIRQLQKPRHASKGRRRGLRQNRVNSRSLLRQRALSASMSFGTTLCTSPTMPRSAMPKIGASPSLLTQMMLSEPFMPTMCCVAPEMPSAM